MKGEAIMWTSPMQQLKQLGVKVEAGQILNPVELGMSAHPQYGVMPTVKVLEAKADGSVFLLGEIKCECGETRQIHPGDWFQVRSCLKCAKRARRGSEKLSEAEKTARAAERAAKVEQNRLVKAQTKAEAQAEKARKTAEAAQAKVESLRAAQ
jgi:hypothetical protein